MPIVIVEDLASRAKRLREAVATIRTTHGYANNYDDRIDPALEIIEAVAAEEEADASRYANANR